MYSSSLYTNDLFQQRNKHGDDKSWTGEGESVARSKSNKLLNELEEFDNRAGNECL